MSKFGAIGRGIMFVVVGIVTIIVGSFLLRGNMHMWDKTKPKKPKEKVWSKMIYKISFLDSLKLVFNFQEFSIGN